MSTIRVGVIGLGGICRFRHAPGLQRIEGVELVAVANRSRESGQAAAEEFGIPDVHESWMEIVSREDIDAIVIGTWPYMHHPISIAALQAGKHVFCQARMAMNLTEAKEMHEVAHLSKRVAMLCPVPFGLSIDRTIARMLAEGTLGDIHLVRVKSLSDASVDPEAPMDWRKDHRLSGLNALTMGMYIEVLHRWFGPTRSVHAETQIRTPARRDLTGQTTQVKVPDQVLFNTTMDNGVVAQCVISGLALHGRDAIDIYGSKQVLHYDVWSDSLYTVNENGQTEKAEILPEDNYDVENWRVEQDFIDAIREGKEYHPDFLDGLRYMQVVQAIHDSAKERRTIELEEIG